jgi:agmatine deiminase
MTWPCRPGAWDDLETARATYVEVARAIARFEPVTMTADADGARVVRRVSAAEPAVDVVVVPSDDSRARDTAPTFVVDGRGGLGGVDRRFNAYGGIYEEYGRTRGMARRILDLLGARRFAAPLVLERGAVHVDGQGTVPPTATTRRTRRCTRTWPACARRPMLAAARWRSSSCRCRRARSTAGAGSPPAPPTSTSPTAGS